MDNFLGIIVLYLIILAMNKETYIVPVLIWFIVFKGLVGF